MQHHASSSAMPVDDDLIQAARAFFPDLVAVDALAGHPHIAKVVTPAGLRRVRRWQPGTTEGDVGFSREVMAAARAAGLILVPALVDPPAAADEPALRLGDRLYDAQEWLAGRPPPRAEAYWPAPEDPVDIPATLAAAPFSAVIAAAARLHDAATTLAKRPDIPAAPLAMLPGAVRQAHERHLRALRARARREPAIQRWLATSERLIASAEPVVAEATPDESLATCVLHLGLWPAHILLDEGTVVGLLGWEQIAVGSPLLDLAQATLRLQGWSDEAVESAVGSYSDVRPLSPAERRLLPAVAALDAVATTGRLLEQTYTVAETARPPTALRAGIDMMLGSLSALERSLTAQAAVGKSKRTPWRRGPLPPPRRQGGTPRERRG